MNKNAAFTICAKNYLAQALTLKKSFIKNNSNSDFFIFLSDLDNNEEEIKSNIVQLDESWLPNWNDMAFKYNVIEFSTSIKPFCFNKLFGEGYEKVIYLDPDIYVTNSLNVIYDFLENKSIILTPHYCNIQTEYSGSITEEEILFVGIYNLGFTAIKNDKVGFKIIEWWMNRLSNKCFADKIDALHVDQKWMDFIPAFFPDEVLITHHMGINPAIWNLHERELFITDSNEYFIRNKENLQIFPLLFFHFSGFDPFHANLINRRHPEYNTDVYPSYKPLFKEYVDAIYVNGYEDFSKFSYSFNSFQNGENILPLHRRLYREMNIDLNYCNPFLSNNLFFKTLQKNRLLSGVKSDKFSIYTDHDREKRGKFEQLLIFVFRILKGILGVRYYFSFIRLLNENTRLEKQVFLIAKRVK